MQTALDWSATVGRAVHASRRYRLTAALAAKANTTLIATPSARFIRDFGGDAANSGTAMLTSLGTGDQPNIHIEGGLWGFDYGAGGPMTWGPVTASFAYVPGSGNPGISIITFGGGLQYSDFDPYTKAVYLFGVPTSANNNRVFAFVPDQTGTSANQIRVIGKVTDETGIAGFTAQVVPPAGGGLSLLSTGGLVRGVNLINTRGTAFFVGGDRFQLLDSTARNAPVDGGGGVRFTQGADLLGSRLYIECSDDCFQFNASATNAVIERGVFADSFGKTNQGALIAFPSGEGRAYGSSDTNTLVRDCVARNIRGVTGGSALHGGVAIKYYCASSGRATTNCWVEDAYIRQNDVTPPDGFRAGVMVITGRAGGGVLNSGVRGLVIENRSGPLLAIAPADAATEPFSKRVDFTVERASGDGKGTWPGLPLISAPFAERLVLRDLSGDLSGSAISGDTPGPALEIGVDVTYFVGGVGYTIAAGTVKDLVIDGCATSNAALPVSKGVWRLGNIGKASIRRLSTTVATIGSGVGGIELTQPIAGPGPTWCRFAEIDFTNILAGKEIVAWQTKEGNQIVDSIRFDDRTETIALPASGTTAISISPMRFAPTIVLTLASGTATINAMSPPGNSVPSPRCTLVFRRT